MRLFLLALAPVLTASYAFASFPLPYRDAIQCPKGSVTEEPIATFRDHSLSKLCLLPEADGALSLSNSFRYITSAGLLVRTQDWLIEMLTPPAIDAYRAFYPTQKAEIQTFAPTPDQVTAVTVSYVNWAIDSIVVGTSRMPHLETTTLLFNSQGEVDNAFAFKATRWDAPATEDKVESVRFLDGLTIRERKGQDSETLECGNTQTTYKRTTEHLSKDSVRVLYFVDGERFASYTGNPDLESSHLKAQSAIRFMMWDCTEALAATIN